MEENKELLTRIAYCVVAALVIYYAGDKVSGLHRLELLDKYKPWIEENKIQAIAVVTAVLFGLSLAFFPIPPEATEENENF